MNNYVNQMVHLYMITPLYDFDLETIIDAKNVRSSQCSDRSTYQSTKSA